MSAAQSADFERLEPRLLMAVDQFTRNYTGQGSTVGDDILGLPNKTITALSFENVVNVRKGPGADQLRSRGLNDAGLIVLNNDGVRLWSARVGTAAANDFAISLAYSPIDKTTYLAGVSFEQAESTGWIAGFDNKGERKFLWEYPGFNIEDIVVRRGALFAAGFGTRAVEIGDEEFGSFNDFTVRGYMARFDRIDGDVRWANEFRSPANGAVQFSHLVYNSDRNSLNVGGIFNGDNVNFDPGGDPDFALDAGATTKGVLASYKLSGAINWAKELSGSIGGIDTFKNGNLLVGLNYSGTITAGDDEFESKGERDGLISRINGGNGNFINSKSFGGTLSDVILGVYTDGDDNAYVAGAHGGTSDLRPGQGTFNHTAVGGENTFFIELSPSLGFDEAFTVEQASTGFNFPRAFDVLSNGNIVGAITYTETIEFNLGRRDRTFTAEGFDFLIYNGTYLH